MVGGGRPVGLHGAERGPRVPPDRDAVAAAEDFHADIVAQRVVPGPGQNAHRAAAEPERRHTDRDVAVPGERLEPGVRSVGVHLRHLLADDVTDDVEVVDVEVTEESAGPGNVFVMRGMRIVPHHAHDVDSAERPVAHQLASAAVAGIEPALKSHLHDRLAPLDMADHVLGGREVDRDRLFAERRAAGVRGLPEEVGMGDGGRGDDERVDFGQHRLDRWETSPPMSRATAAARAWSGSVTSTRSTPAMSAEDAGVEGSDPADAGDADAHRVQLLECLETGNWNAPTCVWNVP